MGSRESGIGSGDVTQATLVDIADDVTTQLAAAYGASKVSANIAVERRYISRFKVSELAEFDETKLADAGLCRVVVTPLSEETDGKTSLRGQLAVVPKVSIILAAKPANGSDGQVSEATVDALLFLLEELKDFFFRKDATLRAIEVETVTHPDLEALLLNRQFVAQFVLTFNDYRNRRGT